MEVSKGGVVRNDGMVGRNMVRTRKWKCGSSANLQLIWPRNGGAIKRANILKRDSEFMSEQIYEQKRAIE